MPSTIDKYVIGSRTPGRDARVKLSPEDKEAIRRQFRELGVSKRSLARMWGVTRRTIQFTLDPSKLAAHMERRRETGGSAQYYDKAKNREYTATHRRRKRKMLENREPLVKVR